MTNKTNQRLLSKIENSNNAELVSNKDDIIFIKTQSFEGLKEFSDAYLEIEEQRHLDEELNKVATYGDSSFNISHQSGYTTLDENYELNNESPIKGQVIIAINTRTGDQTIMTYSSSAQFLKAWDEDGYEVANFENIEKLEKRIGSENVEELYGAIDFNNQELVNSIENKEEVLQKPDLLTTTSKYPLNTFRTIVAGNENELLENSERIYIDDSLYKHSLYNMRNTKQDQSSENNIVDLLFFDKFMKEKIYTEDYMDSENIHSNYKLGSPYRDIKWYMMADLSEISKTLIVKDYEGTIIENYKNEMNNKDSFHNIPDFFIEFSKQMLSTEHLSQVERNALVINNIFNSNVSEDGSLNIEADIEKEFKDIVKNKKIDLNKLAINIIKNKPEMADYFIEMIKEYGHAKDLSPEIRSELGIKIEKKNKYRM